MSCLNPTFQIAAVVTNPNVLLLAADIMSLFRCPRLALETKMECGVLGFRFRVIGIKAQLKLVSQPEIKSQAINYISLVSTQASF